QETGPGRNRGLWTVHARALLDHVLVRPDAAARPAADAHLAEEVLHPLADAGEEVPQGNQDDGGDAEDHHDLDGLDAVLVVVEGEQGIRSGRLGELGHGHSSFWVRRQRSARPARTWALWRARRGEGRSLSPLPS